MFQWKHTIIAKNVSEYLRNCYYLFNAVAISPCNVQCTDRNGRPLVDTGSVHAMQKCLDDKDVIHARTDSHSKNPSIARKSAI